MLILQRGLLQLKPKDKLHHPRMIKRKKKRSYHIGLRNVRKRVKRRIQRSAFVKRKGRRQRNLLRRSYFRRYMFGRRKRRLYKRIQNLTKDPFTNYNNEIKILIDIKDDIKYYMQKQWQKKSQRIISTFKPLYARNFIFGRVYITHHRRNTFITIFRVVGNNIKDHKYVAYKASVGLVGYRGPKKKTKQARESVAHAAGAFLAENQYTTIDIILTSGIGWIYKKLIRALFADTIYVRHMFITRRRSHGFTRRKKKRRT